MSKKLELDSLETITELNQDLLGGVWPGIQLYYPPIKYSSSLGAYEDMAAASKRMKKHGS